MKYANLHLHSTYSDGGFTPLQLTLIGKSLGYCALALTDHETDGGNSEFFAATQSQGIRVIREAGGIAVFAHPYHQVQYVEKLMEFGFNGIEVSHPDLYENTAALAKEAAEAFGLYKAGGTDHTGAMSCCDGVYAIPALQGITEEEYTILTERRLG